MAGPGRSGCPPGPTVERTSPASRSPRSRWLRADPGLHVVPGDWAKRRGNARFGTQAECAEERRFRHGSASRSFGHSASHHVIRSPRSVTALSTRSRRRPCWGRVKSRGLFGGRVTSRGAPAAGRRPRMRGETEGDSSAKSAHSVTTSHSRSRSMARDTGILQDHDSRGERRLDPRAAEEKWWTGGELNSRHRDFQSRAVAFRGADLRIRGVKRGPSGFTS